MFRKDTTDPAKATEEASKATVGGQYRKSLGSSDLNAHYTSDTIFYSDGSNLLQQGRKTLILNM